MYHKLEQHEKLRAIVVLNVAAYIPKDLSPADLQKKQQKKPHTQNNKYFCNLRNFL